MASNYPAGAEHDPNAPYNEPVIPERDFDVEVTITMSKVVTVTTNDYLIEHEDGNTYVNTQYTEWDKAFESNGHFTIEDLIEELKGYVVEDMKTCAPNTGKGAHLQRLLLACDDWKTIEESYEEQ